MGKREEENNNSEVAEETGQKDWMWILNERLLSIYASHIELVNENRTS